MTDYRGLIDLLIAGAVDFIIVGGAAATAHGSSRLTEDLDLVYSRDGENVRKLVAALAPLKPYPRDVPRGLPFKWDETTLLSGLNFTLSTLLGPLDLFGEITLGGSYEELLPHTVWISVWGKECRCLSLLRLIEVKRAAGRAKDFEVIAELELILEEQAS